MKHHDQQFNLEKNSSTEKANLQKSVKNTLTELSTAASLEIAPEGPQADRRVLRQNIGGKVDTTQPPPVSGFFMPPHLTGDNTSLPGGYGIENRLRGNTCGASYVAPKDSRQFYDCQNLRYNIGLTAMNANTHGTATPVAATPGASSDQCNNCLLPPQVVTDAIKQSKVDAASTGYHGSGNAYAQLLNQFHAAIFPQLILETGGNIAKISRLLGIHRESVVRYAKRAGFYEQLGAKRGGVQS